MGRLIDADALIQKLLEKSVVDGVNIISTTYTYKELAYIICNQPTAYDVEKVIELADRRIEFLDATNKIFFDSGDFKNADLNAIRMKEVIAIKEVVRKGGV